MAARRLMLDHRFCTKPTQPHVFGDHALVQQGIAPIDRLSGR
jgi:hypothetical protein